VGEGTPPLPRVLERERERGPPGEGGGEIVERGVGREGGVYVVVTHKSSIYGINVTCIHTCYVTLHVAACRAQYLEYDDPDHPTTAMVLADTMPLQVNANVFHV
jgi:hypothetical protein